VLRRISETMRDEVPEVLKKLYNKEHHNLYSPNVIRMIPCKEYEMGMACSIHGREEK
jgi:hypothetical protein